METKKPKYSIVLPGQRMKPSYRRSFVKVRGKDAYVANPKLEKAEEPAQPEAMQTYIERDGPALQSAIAAHERRKQVRKKEQQEREAEEARQRKERDQGIAKHNAAVFGLVPSEKSGE